MIWWLVLLWVIVVGVPTAYVGLKAARVARKANALQSEIQTRMTALQTGGLLTLAAKQEELQANLARLTEAMQQLQRSLDTLKVLIDRFRSAIGPLRFFLRFLRA